ncbi:MAG: SIS domain-containing protein [Myxococcota bacterium]
MPSETSSALDAEALVHATLAESARVKQAVADTLTAPIARAGGQVAEAFRAGGKALLFGNGGSASDAQHIAAEWTGKLGPDRPALPAIALSANTSDLTAIGNDYGFEQVFARLVEAHGREGDVAIAISTSGGSPNVIAAVEEAHRRGLRTIGLLGRGGGKLAERVELPLVVPSADTQRIQECHIAIAHAIAELVDRLLFPELTRS